MRKQITIAAVLAVALAPGALAEEPQIEDGTYTCDPIFGNSANMLDMFRVYNKRFGHTSLRVTDTGSVVTTERSAEINYLPEEITFSDNAQALSYRGFDARMVGRDVGYLDSPVFTGDDRQGKVMTVRVHGGEGLRPYDIGVSVSEASHYGVRMDFMKCYK